MSAASTITPPDVRGWQPRLPSQTTASRGCPARSTCATPPRSEIRDAGLPRPNVPKHRHLPLVPRGLFHHLRHPHRLHGKHRLLPLQLAGHRPAALPRRDLPGRSHHRPRHAHQRARPALSPGPLRRPAERRGDRLLRDRRQPGSRIRTARYSTPISFRWPTSPDPDGSWNNHARLDTVRFAALIDPDLGRIALPPVAAGELSASRSPFPTTTGSTLPWEAASTNADPPSWSPTRHGSSSAAPTPLPSIPAAQSSQAMGLFSAEGQVAVEIQDSGTYALTGPFHDRPPRRCHPRVPRTRGRAPRPCCSRASFPSPATRAVSSS